MIDNRHADFHSLCVSEYEFVSEAFTIASVPFFLIFFTASKHHWQSEVSHHENGNYKITSGSSHRSLNNKFTFGSYSLSSLYFLRVVGHDNNNCSSVLLRSLFCASYFGVSSREKHRLENSVISVLSELNSGVKIDSVSLSLILSSTSYRIVFDFIRFDPFSNRLVSDCCFWFCDSLTGDDCVV